jgi:hypothetical protein
MTPLGRAGLPEDVALPTVFLASDDARHLTLRSPPLTADEISIFASPLVGGTTYRPKAVGEYRQWLSREFHSHADAVFAAYPARTDA